MHQQKGKKLVMAAGVFMAIFSYAVAQGSLRNDRKKMYYRFFGFRSFVKNGSIRANWMQDGNSFWYAAGNQDNTVIYVVDPLKNTKTPLFDTQRLRQALTPILGHEPSHKGLPFDSFTFINEEKAAKFTVENKKFILDLNKYTITPDSDLPEDKRPHAKPRIIEKKFYSEDVELMEISSPDHQWFLGTEDYNVYIRSQYDGRIEKLTKDGVEDNEWSIRGAKWSPDSLKIAVKKVDQRRVHRFPIVHWLKKKEDVEWLPYTKSGGPLPRTELFIIDIPTQTKTRVKIHSEADQYINIIGWMPDGSELIFTKANRVWNSLELLAADRETGSTRLILRETSKTFIGGLGKDLTPVFF